MVTIQIYDTGQVLEAIDADITYIKVAGDLADITAINSSYSWSMKFPKNPNNTQVLEGLGLVGSGSTSPYRKIYCNLLDNGYPIAVKALLNVKATNADSYDIFIQEGFVDFQKDITNDTLGEALDLSELDHTRDINTITNSFALNLPYAYLISDVNGGYKANVNNTTNLDPQYMAPFANVGYLWDLIFSTYGWNFTIAPDVRISLNATWMSYPSEIVYDDSNPVQVAAVSATNVQARPLSRSNQVIPLPSGTLDSGYVTRIGAFEFRVLYDGNYTVSFGSTGIVYLEDRYGNRRTTRYTNRLYVNGQLVASGETSDAGTTRQVQIQFHQGDVVSLHAAPFTTDQDTSVDVDQATLTIGVISQGEVSFTSALIKYKVVDFIKEIMVREALTSFVDVESKTIKFLTLNERLDAEVVDWSSKYVRRTNETYLYRDYAQKNYFRHKYSSEFEDFNDGVLNVPNENLDEEATIYQSNSFSPDENFSTFVSNGTEYPITRLPMFEIEVKEVGGAIDLNYKFIKDRFFFVKSQQSDRDIYIDGNLQNGYPSVSVGDSTFKNIFFTKYASFGLLSEQAKVHEIELALSVSDIVHLDLSKRYRFDQEAAIYILNRLKWKSGKITTGEFIMARPQELDHSFSNAFSNAFRI